jgi:hypothetical protein
MEDFFNWKNAHVNMVLLSMFIVYSRDWDALFIMYNPFYLCLQMVNDDHFTL